MITIAGDSGDRFCIIGQSGSGKTVAAAFILRYWKQPVIVVDVKGEPTFQRAFSGSFIVVDSASKLWHYYSKANFAKIKAFIYQPGLDELHQLDDVIKAVFHTALEIGDLAIVIDEAYTVADNPGLVACLTRGRSLGVTTFVVTQRPRWVSRFAFTEATHVLAFYLQDLEDRVRVSQFTPITVEMFDELKAYEFWYWSIDRKHPIKGKVEPSFLDVPIQTKIWV